jgi:hypothetical protein
MIRLLPDTADQTVVMTLDESRILLDESFTHYLLVITREENSVTGEDLAQVPTVLADNTRYTQLEVTTEGLTVAGQYRYVVYGQNSSSNLDPNDSSVVGELEIGWLELYTNDNYISQRNTTIPNDIVHG